jgi:hypothetical protein
MKYNLISDLNLKKSIPYFKKKTFQQASYIFDELNFGCYFYILIRGKICILNNRVKSLLFDSRDKRKGIYITQNTSKKII